MILQNLGHHWNPRSECCDGYIIQAYGIDVVALMDTRRGHDLFDEGNLFFDPQLYLAGLDAAKCAKIVSRLATYPWFLSNAPKFDIEETCASEFRKEVAETDSLYIEVPSAPEDIRTAIIECTRTQRILGLEQIVVPAPLIDETGLNTYMKWIDIAIENDCIGDEDLVSLPIRSGSFARSPSFIDAMIDNLSARERIRGVYVVIVSDDNTKRLKDLPVAEGLLRLCYCLGKTADIKVIVNYVDDFGLLCRAFGASAFGAGHTLKERRAYPPDYEEADGWGFRYPYFYSNSLFADFLSNDGLNQFRNAELLWIFDEDETDLCRPLLKALEEGKSANDVPQWRQEHMRIQTAQEHKMQLLKKVDTAIDTYMENEPIGRGVSMARQAHMKGEYCKKRLPDTLEQDLAHLEVWKNACERASRHIGEAYSIAEAFC